MVTSQIALLINYDIHWNRVRIILRFGQINETDNFELIT